MDISLFLMRLAALKFAISQMESSRLGTVGGPMFPPYESLLRQAIKELLEVLDGE